MCTGVESCMLVPTADLSLTHNAQRRHRLNVKAFGTRVRRSGGAGAVYFRAGESERNR